MRNYERTTRICAIDQLRPEAFNAIQEYFNANYAGELESESLLCSETISRKKAGGWLSLKLNKDRDETFYTAILLTKQSLVWVRSGKQSGIQIIGANLKDIQVKLYNSILTKDTGLEVRGIIGDSKTFMRGYIGLGTEEATEIFCEEVRQSVEKVNPTPVIKLPDWLLGLRR